MSEIKPGDIVKFNDKAVCRAATFCRKHGITGKVVGEEHTTIAIDVGFYYKIWAQPDQLDKIISPNQIPELVE